MNSSVKSKRNAFDCWPCSSRWPRDLRQVESALKVITDLERIGDHAVDIAKIARKLTQEFYLKAPLLDVAPLAERASTMLHQSLESLVRHDLELAVRVCNDDDHADDALQSLA